MSRLHPLPSLTRPWGIRTRFIVALVAFAFILSASFASVATRLAGGALYTQAKSRGLMMQKRLAKDIVDAGELDEPLEREITFLLLSSRMMLDDGLYVHAVLDGEEVIASAIDGWDHRLDLPVSEDSAVEEIRGNGQRGLDFFAPLPPGDEGPSYVRFGISLAPVDDDVRSLLVTMAWTASIFCIVGLIIALWLYRGIFGPLRSLLSTVRRLAAGDHDARTELTTEDELGEIAMEFNRMADSIAARTAELQRANERLARADEAKSEFLATMSHEWKTPLHALRGYAQILLEEVDGPLNGAQREDVEAMLAAGNHLLDLIDNILHFIQAHYDDGDNHWETLDLAAIARQAWEHVRPAARDRDIVFQDDLPHALVIRGDRTRLRQVMINLLGNAVKYISSGTITVSADMGGDDVRVHVTDTGPGIDADDYDVIFEPFERLHRRGNGHIDGLGLGLAVAGQYVAAHDGHLTVTSEVGVGSTFTVTLPVQSGKGSFFKGSDGHEPDPRVDRGGRSRISDTS